MFRGFHKIFASVLKYAYIAYLQLAYAKYEIAFESDISMPAIVIVLWILI